MRLLPRNFRSALFMTLAMLNLGIASFFAAACAFEQAAFSGIAGFLCCAVWFSEIYKNSEG